MSDFTNQVVIVTGAAGNLGVAVARAFATAGATLVLVDHGADRLRAQFPALADSPNHLLAESVDVNQPDLVDKTVSDAMARFGQIDILVNTVGGYRGGTAVHETPLEVWDQVFELNARGTFIVCRAIIPHMLARRSGKIINVSSRAALAGSAKGSAYSASKSAVLRLTESMSAELRPHGINVSCVLPSTIDTPQNRQSMPDADFTKWVQPEAIADVILFLSSPAARAVHAAALSL